MRVITKITPVDPAQTSARRIVDKVYDKVFHIKLAEVERLLKQRISEVQESDAHAR